LIAAAALAILGMPLVGAAPPSAPASLTAHGPHAVTVLPHLVIPDAARKRALAIKVYAPQGRGPHPVVVFSHDLDGSKDSFGPLARFWASHGFVSIHPTHADTLPRATVATGRNAALERLLRSPAAWEDRTRDITLVLDSLPELERLAPELRGKLDPKRVAVAGHAFGALTAALVAGATVDVPGERDRSFVDPRVQAVLLFSPQGTGQHGLTVRSWRKLTHPMMTVAGGRDFVTPSHGPVWRKQPYRYSPAGGKYHVFIQDAGPLSFGGELAGGGLATSALGPRAAARLGGGRRFAVGSGAAERPETFRAVKASTLAFWKAQLKQDTGAREYLSSKNLERDFNGRVTLELR